MRDPEQDFLNPCTDDAVAEHGFCMPIIHKQPIVKQSWQKGGRRQPDPTFGGAIAPYLQNINRMLRDEVHTPAPHLCVQNAATTQLYVLVSSVGSIARHEQCTHEAFRFFDLLVDSEDEDFIRDAAFADELIRLVRACSAETTILGSDIETEMVELLFAVTAQIRQQPEIPAAWFRPSIDIDHALSPSASIAVPKVQEFPLVYMLLDYVHYDGKIGDFARTGLLYILESAARSSRLEKWIIESELATMMASGLGALYSQLSSGSSVAVMSYLRYILESLTHIDLIRMLLRYMLGSPGEQQQDTTPSRPTALARRRKSETLILNDANRHDDPSPDLLTLTNILQGYLASRNQQTVLASLRLLATILRSWHDMAATRLFRTQLIKTAGRKRSVDIHEQCLDMMYSMAEDILDDEGLGRCYDCHLRDAQVIIETHPCSTQQLLLPEPDCFEAILSQHSCKSLQQRNIVPEDPVFMCLMYLLEDFLVNEIEVNLSLSGNLAALASCSDTRLEGWLLGPTADNTPPLRHEVKAKTADASPNDAQTSENTCSAVSPVLIRLSALVERISKLRLDIQDFDIYLAERRHVFKVGEEIDDAITDASVRESQDLGDVKKSKTRDQIAVRSMSERLGASSDVSRASLPRGRQQDNFDHRQAPAKSLVGRLNHSRFSPSPNPSKTLERTYPPSPLRRTSTSSRTSSGLPSPRGPPDVLHRKLRLKTNAGHQRHLRESTDSEASSIRSESTRAEPDLTEETREISLSHLLTNVIILQEFILELVAIIQVRASLFGEVSLD
ncbi:MAG: hypothetical protein Q9166_003049 [cf. Caloplaca sp. 2 TL-2023]